MAAIWLVSETTSARRLRTNSWRSVSIHVLVEGRGSSKQAFDLQSKHTAVLYHKPVLYNFLGWEGEECWSFQCPIVVEDFGFLKVDVETPADVSPHNNIANI